MSIRVGAPRPFEDPVRDVARLQAFNGEAIATSGHAGYLHPGDIPHRIFNGHRNERPSEVVWIWEDGDAVAAWAMLYPRDQAFDLQLDPRLRSKGGVLERRLLTSTADRLGRLLERRNHGASPGEVVTDAFVDDEHRVAVLAALGWERGETSYVLTTRDVGPVDGAEVPAGYSIRSAAGVGEAEQLAEVHASSFGSTWRPGEYERVMTSPGYDADRELVVVAPDGGFAGFTIVWLDHRNRIGVLEPVGVHRDHRRSGLGRALVAAGVAKMASEGMETATVMYATVNEAAGQLYASCGFEPRWPIVAYRSAVNPDS